MQPLRGGGAGRGGGGADGGQWGQLLAGEVVLQRGEEVADHRDAPGLPQDLLPLLPAHVPHVGVVFGEAEDPGEQKEEELQSQREPADQWNPEDATGDHHATWSQSAGRV